GDGTGELSCNRPARPWPGAGAEISRRGRSRPWHPGAGAVELPAAFGAGIATLSAQPAAFAARSRVHRLCDAGILANVRQQTVPWNHRIVTTLPVIPGGCHANVFGNDFGRAAAGRGRLCL